MRWELDDGGREAAGFRGLTRDCATRAVAIATGLPYREVYDGLNREAGKAVARTGVPVDVAKRFLAARGWRWVPTMGIGTGCRVHLDELPAGRIIARVSRHFVAVIDGVARDTFDSTRGGRRCVYGYFIREAGDELPDGLAAADWSKLDGLTARQKLGLAERLIGRIPIGEFDPADVAELGRMLSRIS